MPHDDPALNRLPVTATDLRLAGYPALARFVDEKGGGYAELAMNYAGAHRPRLPEEMSREHQH